MSSFSYRKKLNFISKYMFGYKHLKCIISFCSKLFSKQYKYIFAFFVFNQFMVMLNSQKERRISVVKFVICINFSVSNIFSIFSPYNSFTFSLKENVCKILLFLYQNYFQTSVFLLISILFSLNYPHTKGFQRILKSLKSHPVHIQDSLPQSYTNVSY